MEFLFIGSGANPSQRESDSVSSVILQDDQSDNRIYQTHQPKEQGAFLQRRC
jgi:hypothetical protein